MKPTGTIHFQQENQLLKLLEDYELDVFTTDDLRQYDETRSLNLQATLESLARRDPPFLVRLEKGKYVHRRFRDELVIGCHLAKDGVIAYWSALNRHGLTEQFPNQVFVQTGHLKRPKTVLGVAYQFVQVKPAKLIGYETVGYGNHRFRLTDVEKTLADCFDLPQYAGGYAELLRAFAGAEVDSGRLIRYCEAIGNVSATKRLGYLTEFLQKPGMIDFLRYAEGVVGAGYSLFDPFGVNEGAFIRRWRLRMNLPEADILAIVGAAY
jgi:predicted transcriptional regulator of viral defense system